MKNIYLLIFILIFLYIICNGYIEKFSVGCQSIKKTPINISGSLTLPYINKCNPTPTPTPTPSLPKCPIESGLLNLNACSDINFNFNTNSNTTNCSDFFEYINGKGYKCKTGSNPKTCVKDLDAECT